MGINRGEEMLRDYANSLILAVIAALLLVVVVQLGSVIEAVRATDEGVADMRDQLSFIRGYVCDQAGSNTDECWAHQQPGAQ
jgi:ABC-type Fe3+ transport system permease subunit